MEKEECLLLTASPLTRNLRQLFHTLGIKTKTLKFLVNPNQIKDTTISLQPISLELNPIVKIGERMVEKNVTDLGLAKISVKQLETYFSKRS